MPDKDYEKLMQYAFYIVSRKRYTVKEMRKKLGEYVRKRKLQGAKLVNEGVLRLEELGYLNDESYTKDFLAQRVKLKPRGKFLLKRELFKKGIGKEVIEKGLFDCEIDESELAKGVLLMKAKKWMKYDQKTQKSKAYTFLASRGFERDAIYRAIESCYYSNASWD